MCFTILKTWAQGKKQTSFHLLPNKIKMIKDYILRARTGPLLWPTQMLLITPVFTQQWHDILPGNLRSWKSCGRYFLYHPPERCHKPRAVPTATAACTLTHYKDCSRTVWRNTMRSLWHWSSLYIVYSSILFWEHGAELHKRLQPEDCSSA